MRRVYLASPANQSQCQALIEHELPALISFACATKSVLECVPAFSRVLVDSGAYSTMNSGKPVSLEAYEDFALSLDGSVDAIAGLDDIRGDWRQSLRNYQRVGFPTIHDSDPEKLLDELIPLARERGGWIGVGLVPPREGKEGWVRRTLERIPDDLHVHGWALRTYSHLARLDSVDSTNWWRDGLRLKRDMPWLTTPECLNLVCLRYKREHLSQRIKDNVAKEENHDQQGLFVVRRA